MKKIVIKITVSFVFAFFISLALSLPYINILKIYFDGIVPFSFMIALLVLFKPSRKRILLGGLFLIGLNPIFIILKNNSYAEDVSFLGFFLVLLYVCLELNGISNKK